MTRRHASPGSRFHVGIAAFFVVPYSGRPEIHLTSVIIYGNIGIGGVRLSDPEANFFGKAMNMGNEESERSFDAPNIAWGSPKDESREFRLHETRVYVLRETEYLAPNAWSKHGWQGPGVIVLTLDPSGSRWFEDYCDSPKTWGWITRLLRDGLSESASYEVEVFSLTDRQIGEQEE